MPDQLQMIVQRMIDAGEPEENIATVIRSYKPPVPAGDTYTGPTTYWGGYGQSLKQTATDTAAGIGRGMLRTIDPRTYVHAAQQKGADEQRMVAEIEGRATPSQDYGAGEARALGHALSTPEGGGEAIGGLLAGAALARAVPFAQGRLEAGGTRLMQSATKPTDALVKARAGAGYDSKAAIARAVLQEGRIVTPGSLDKAQAALDATDAAAHQALREGAGAGVTVNPQSVGHAISAQANSRGPFGEQINAAPDVAAIQGVHDAFVENPHLPSHTVTRPVTETVASPIVDAQGQPITRTVTRMEPAGRELDPIPAVQAHRFAMNTGRNLKGKFGRLGNATVEAEKAGRENIVSQLRDQIPELNPLWDAEARQVTVRDALEKATNRTANRDPIGLGGIIGAVKNPSLALTAMADRSAVVKSLLAHGLWRPGVANGAPFQSALRAAILAQLAGGSEPAQDAQGR